MDIHRHNVVATRTNALWQMGRITRWATLWRVATRTNALWQIPCRRGLCMCANRRNPHECAVANVRFTSAIFHQVPVATRTNALWHMTAKSSVPKLKGRVATRTNALWQIRQDILCGCRDGVATRTNALWQIRKEILSYACRVRRNPHECAVANLSEVVL